MNILSSIYQFVLRLRFRWCYGDVDFPRTLRIEVSSHCNRRCSYCPNVFAPSAVKLIDEDVLGAFLARIQEIDWCGNIDFIFFNEPLLHPQIVQIVHRVKLAAPLCSPVISTNGDVLTMEMARALYQAGVVKIFAMHHRPDRPGWMERMKAIRRAFRFRLGIYDITELENSSGLYDYGGKVEVNRVREKHIVNGVPACDMHSQLGQIDINGDWLLCCVDYSRSKSFGNIKRNSLFEIWRGEEFTRLRAELSGGTPTLDICKTCACFTGLQPA